jgi:hypothetical protein
MTLHQEELFVLRNNFIEASFGYVHMLPSLENNSLTGLCTLLLQGI